MSRYLQRLANSAQRVPQRRVRMTALLLVVSSCQGGCPADTSTSATNTVVVTMTGAPATTRSLLVYSGTQSAICDAFDPAVASATQTVTLTAVSWVPSCGAEFDVFTPTAGAFGRRVVGGDAASVSWLSGAIASGAMSISVPPLLSVPVTLWLVASGSNIPVATAMRERQRLSAMALLADLGAGITLDATLSSLGSVSPNCNDAGSISESTSGYSTNQINVYYVEGYMHAPPGAHYACNCWPQGHPEIVFVSWNSAANPDPALAHEIGHALGLIHPQALGGHIQPGYGFPQFNLMESGGPTVTNISTGQMYNMNFSRDSWLNRTGGIARPVVRPCQDAWGAGECAALTMHESTWPP